MVLLSYVIEVFALPNFYRRAALLVVSFDSCCISTTFIYIDFHRSAVVANGLAQEAQSGPSIPFRGQQKVNRITLLIYCTVKVFPLTANFDVGLIEAPTNTNVSFMLLGFGHQKRRIAHNPSIEG